MDSLKLKDDHWLSTAEHLQLEPTNNYLRIELKGRSNTNEIFLAENQARALQKYLNTLFNTDNADSNPIK